MPYQYQGRGIVLQYEMSIRKRMQYNHISNVIGLGVLKKESPVYQLSDLNLFSNRSCDNCGFNYEGCAHGCEPSKNCPKWALSDDYFEMQCFGYRPTNSWNAIKHCDGIWIVPRHIKEDIIQCPKCLKKYSKPRT